MELGRPMFNFVKHCVSMGTGEFYEVGYETARRIDFNVKVSKYDCKQLLSNLFKKKNKKKFAHGINAFFRVLYLFD